MSSHQAQVPQSSKSVAATSAPVDIENASNRTSKKSALPGRRPALQNLTNRLDNVKSSTIRSSALRKPNVVAHEVTLPSIQPSSSFPVSSPPSTTRSTDPSSNSPFNQPPNPTSLPASSMPPPAPLTNTATSLSRAGHQMEQVRARKRPQAVSSAVSSSSPPKASSVMEAVGVTAPPTSLDPYAFVDAGLSSAPESPVFSVKTYSRRRPTRLLVPSPAVPLRVSAPSRPVGSPQPCSLAGLPPPPQPLESIPRRRTQADVEEVLPRDSLIALPLSPDPVTPLSQRRGRGRGRRRNSGPTVRSTHGDPEASESHIEQPDPPTATPVTPMVTSNVRSAPVHRPPTPAPFASLLPAGSRPRPTGSRPGQPSLTPVSETSRVGQPSGSPAVNSSQGISGMSNQVPQRPPNRRPSLSRSAGFHPSHDRTEY